MILIIYRAKWRREEKLRTQQLPAPLHCNVNASNELNSTNDTSSSTETNYKSTKNVISSTTIGSSQQHHIDVVSSANTNVLVDETSSVINDSQIQSHPPEPHSPPRYLNHGYNCGASIYSPQISDSYGLVHTNNNLFRDLFIFILTK